MKDAQYWIGEVDRFLQCIEGASIKIGEALKHLRGDKYKKAAHLWKQDPDPNKPKRLTTFDEYCQWRWGLSKSQIERYIKAYELVEEIEEESPRGNSSLRETEEFVLRPLTTLKKEDRQKGWEMAIKLAEADGKKLSSKHTQRAVTKIRNEIEDKQAYEKAHTKDICAAIDKSNRAELELVQAENLGIAQGRAQAKVTDCLERLFRDENEKAKLYLARLLADRLFKMYPQLWDEPLRSFSLGPP